MTTTQRPQAATPTAAIDAARWPDIAVVPHRPLRAAIAEQIFRRAVARIPLQVKVDGGRDYGGGKGADPRMRLVRPSAFFARLGDSGTIGFGEAYMAGDWITEDLPGVLTAFAANLRGLVPRS